MVDSIAVLCMQINIVCNTGMMTRMGNIFKNNGFSPKLITPNVVRLLLRRSSNGDSQIQRLLSIITSSTTIWKEVCLELWIETHQSTGLRKPFIVQYNGIYVYVRPGIHKATYKLIWIKTRDPYISGVALLPGSMTRKCYKSNDIEQLKADLDSAIKVLTNLSRSLDRMTISNNVVKNKNPNET